LEAIFCPAGSLGNSFWKSEISKERAEGSGAAFVDVDSGFKSGTRWLQPNAVTFGSRRNRPAFLKFS
jgi:hypothetical protein